jgi:group I intron endonuclease
VVSYENIIENQKQIIQDNKCRGGIYRFTNKTNGKKYIGHSKNLSRRFLEYFRIAYLNKRTSMPICNALIKYGHENFRLEILEYCECEASQEKLLEREKYYIQLLPHTERYNIIEDPTLPPMSGRKHSDATKIIMSGRTHSDETKIKMSDVKKGENHPMYGKNHTEETKTKISDALTGENHPMYGKNHTEKIRTKISDAKKGKPRPEGAGSPFQAIEVTDIKKNTKTSYDSVHEAARALNINQSSISMYFIRNQQKRAPPSPPILY